MLPTLLVLFSLSITAQVKDTVSINADNLEIENLNYGNANYLMYARMGKDKPMLNTTLVKINLQKELIDNKNYIVIKQIWETDTIIHTASTQFEEKKLQTIKHNSWWKRKGYSESFDYPKKEVVFEGKIKPEDKTKVSESFKKSFENNFLNWHSDLIIFPLLPFKENRVFKINYYEPGFEAPKEVFYEVLKSKKIVMVGQIIDCWVLNFNSTKPEGYQRFLISKKTKELIKEEDKFGNFYRYKFKQLVSEN